MTELATEMPRCFSISIQSLVACRLALRALTLPAIWIAPAKSSNFSVSVVLPASGCEMIAKVRRRAVSRAIGVSAFMEGTFSHVPAMRLRTYTSTTVRNPPKIIRFASNGIFFRSIISARRGSAMTFFMMRSRSRRDL